MKRMMLVGVVMMLGLFLGLTAQAGPVVYEGIYCTDDDGCDGYFFTKFWKEKFFGGGPGQEGNTLMAIGEGFVFQNAVLTGSPKFINNEKPGWCVDLGGYYALQTLYTGGMLTLNSSGPWLKKGALKAKGISATNISCHDLYWNLLGFALTMEGEFEKSEYSFEIDASFIVTPDNYEVGFDSDDGVFFHRGLDFDAKIKIN